MQHGWRGIVLRSPVGVPVAAVASCSVALSVAALLAATAAFDLGFGGDFAIYLGIATVIPLLVSVPVSWFIVRLLREVDDARQQVQRLAWQDELTGLYNRRRFTELAQRELDLSRRAGHSVIAVMLDLDDFKLINDRHGHGVGDRLLVAVARAIEATLRSTDLAARWGGEEFALLLPATSVEQGLEVLQRLLRVVRELRVHSAEGLSLGITASIGVALPSGDSPRFEQLIERADRAMYRAKLAGKNCVMRCDDTTAAAPAPALPLTV